MSSYIKGATLEKLIHKQLAAWEHSKKVFDEKPETPRPFITISREYGCNATEISSLLADKLNAMEKTEDWNSYDKELINKIVEDHNISEKLIETIDTVKRDEMNELMRTMLTDYPPQVTVYKKLVKTIRSLSIHGKAIIVGRAGVVITRGLKNGLHVKLVAPLPYRVHKIMELTGIKDKLEAEKLVEKKDKERHDFLTQYIKFPAYEASSYDLTINISRFSGDEVAGLIIGALQARNLVK